MNGKMICHSVAPAARRKAAIFLCPAVWYFYTKCQSFRHLGIVKK